MNERVFVRPDFLPLSGIARQEMAAKPDPAETAHTVAKRIDYVVIIPKPVFLHVRHHEVAEAAVAEAVEQAEEKAE